MIKAWLSVQAGVRWSISSNILQYGDGDNIQAFIDMILVLAFFTFLLVGLSAENRVIEITTTNVQLVLRTVDRLHLLLHNPNCQHSREYAQKFLQVKTPLQMGIADCQREKELCQHLNVTHFPALVQLTNATLTHLDEQQFLLKEGLVEESDPKVVLNSIVGRLKGEAGWAAVVLEEEGLPVLERVEQATHNGVFYVGPPSRLYNYLSAMVGRKVGCWILANREGQLKKYYCGNGYKSEDLLKYLENFAKQKLVSHTFTREANSTHMGQVELSQIVKANYATKRCKLVYFHSKNCEHCILNDIKRVDSVLTSLNLNNKYQLQVYDLDHEELPATFRLRRIPELVQFCDFTATQFGDVFTIDNLSTFLSRSRSPPKIKRQQSFKEKSGQKGPEAAGRVADERLEL